MACSRTHNRALPQSQTLSPSPGGYRDWRIPTVEELRTILSADCPAGVCIDPIFGAADGYYWTSTSGVGGSAWIVGVYTRVVGTQYNTDFQHARAVRGGR